MYDIHEDLVKNMRDNAEAEAFPPSADERVLYLWQCWPCRILLFPRGILKLIGAMYGKHFAVVCGVPAADGRTWLAFSGVVNDVADNRPDEGVATSWSKRLVSLLRIERWFPNTIEMDWNWFLCKFEAEYQVTRVLHPNDADDRFEKYMSTFLCFAAKWAQMPDVSLSWKFELLDLLWQHLKGNRASRPVHLYQLDGFGKMINWFYLHGN